PFLVEGFIVWPDPDSGGFPRSSELRGLGAVPIWFVKLSELQDAMADGEVTILELASLPSLRVGTATFYQEQLHYFPPAPRSSSEIRATGTLADGGSFSVRAIEIQLEWNNVSIVFK